MTFSSDIELRPQAQYFGIHVGCLTPEATK
jgi:hypothetical protein